MHRKSGEKKNNVQNYMGGISTSKQSHVGKEHEKRHAKVTETTTFRNTTEAQGWHTITPTCFTFKLGRHLPHRVQGDPHELPVSEELREVSGAGEPYVNPGPLLLLQRG